MVSKGGNLLLNIAPTGRGEFDVRALDRPQSWATYNPTSNRLYVHVLTWPFGQLYLDSLDPAHLKCWGQQTGIAGPAPPDPEA